MKEEEEEKSRRIRIGRRRIIRRGREGRRKTGGW